LGCRLGASAGEWTLADWCDQCHRKGGLVIGNDFFAQPYTPLHREVLADVIRGKIDALQMDGIENAEFDRGLQLTPLLNAWYQLLDAGFRVPLVGGSGKTNNATPLGCSRTYALLQPGQPLTYKNWIEAVRAGRTSVTTGPLLTFTVNGQPPGAVVDVPATSPAVCVGAAVRAHSLDPFERLQIVASNRVVAEAEAAGDPPQATVEAEVALPQGGWLVARCWGPSDEDRGQWRGAQSSPVYVQVEGRRAPPDPAAVATLADWLDKAWRGIEQGDPSASESQRQRRAALFEEAQRILRAPR
jgi:hypothetical protein